VKDELKMYRVYGRKGLDSFDEYLYASNAQTAVDKVREWFEGECEVLEVAKVVKGWK